METLTTLSLIFYIIGAALAWREDCAWNLNLHIWRFGDKEKPFPCIDNSNKLMLIISASASWISFLLLAFEYNNKRYFKPRWLPRLNKQEKAVYELWCSENVEDNQFAVVLAEQTGNKNLAEYITKLIEKERRWK